MLAGACLLALLNMVRLSTGNLVLLVGVLYVGVLIFSIQHIRQHQQSSTDILNYAIVVLVSSRPSHLLFSTF